MVPVSDPVSQTFIVHSSVLALKMLGMGCLTARQRHIKEVFANEEDAKETGGKLTFDDPDVERIRRAHLNDLENIPAFWLIGCLYLTTEPFAEVATWLFRLYTTCRLVHTLVYAFKPVPQPARGIAFGLSNLACVYMGVRVVMHYFHAL